MGLFDGGGFNLDPTTLTLASLAQAAAQTAMPTDRPVPTGAVFGNLGGALTNAANTTTDIDKKKLETDLLRAQVPVMQQRLQFGQSALPLYQKILQQMFGGEGGGSGGAGNALVGGAPASAFGSLSPSGSGNVSDPRGVAPLIRDAALRYGHDPDIAVKVAKSEGLGTFLGDGGKSGSAFQLYTGGGLGNEFQKETGLDPLDPKNEPHAIDWAMRNLSRTGWGPYHGAARSGIGARDGIDIGSPGNMPAVPNFAGMMSGNQGPSYAPPAQPQMAGAGSGGGSAPAAFGSMSPQSMPAPSQQPAPANLRPDFGNLVRNGMLPPGVRVNSQGMPYSGGLNTMSPQEQANVAASMAAIKNAQGQPSNARGAFGSMSPPPAPPPPVQMAQAGPAAPQSGMMPGSLAPPMAGPPQSGHPALGVDPRLLAVGGSLAQLAGWGDTMKPLENYYYQSPQYKAAIERATEGVKSQFVGPNAAAKAEAEYPTQARLQTGKADLDLRNANATTTTDIKDYQAYAQNQQSLGKPPLSFGEWDIARKNAGAANVQQKVEGNAQGELVKAGIKAMEDAHANEMAANKRTQVYGQMAQAMQGFTPGATAELRLSGERVLKDLGIIKGENVPPAEIFQQAGRHLAIAAAPKGQGATSNYERELYSQAVPNMTNSPEGLTQAIAIGKRLDDYDRQVAQIHRDVAREHNSIPNYVEATQRIAALGPPLSAGEMAGLERLKPGQQGGAPGQPGAPAAPPTATGPNGQKLILQNGQWTPYTQGR